jgi:rhodanese-related sulfurtransferase
MITTIGPVDLRRIITAEGEIALLDVSEEGQFGLEHLLPAVNLPYSKLELEVGRLVPRRACPVVLIDRGDGIAPAAARRLENLGYTDLTVLEGGTAAWEAAGFQLFKGVNVMSKAFGEFVEHEFATPSISAAELEELFRSGADVVLLDCRTVEEYAQQHVPNAVSCPGGELVYRFRDLVPSPETLVVVSCAGRTRGIVGSQSLINAGFENRIVALSGGTQGWCIEGFELERGLRRQFGPVSLGSAAIAGHSAQTVAERFGIRRIDRATLELLLADAERTTYVLDVRPPEEFRAGHLAGSASAPGGQLIQATDQWIGTRGARIVLVDDDGARATMTAQWLTQMGWDVSVLEDALAGVELVSGSVGPQPMSVLGGTEIEPSAAAERIAGGAMAIVVDASASFRLAHPPGAVWANRSRLGPVASALAARNEAVLFSADGGAAHLAALDLSELSGRPCFVVRGGMAAWTKDGHPVVASPDQPPDADRVDFLFWIHDRHSGNIASMHEYLAWEMELPELVAADGSAGFRLRPNVPRKESV